jgi:hypothetical protein
LFKIIYNHFNQVQITPALSYWIDDEWEIDPIEEPKKISFGFIEIHQISNILKGYKYEIYPNECLDGVCDFAYWNS